MKVLFSEISKRSFKLPKSGQYGSRGGNLGLSFNFKGRKNVLKNRKEVDILEIKEREPTQLKSKTCQIKNDVCI